MAISKLSLISQWHFLEKIDKRFSLSECEPSDSWRYVWKKVSLIDQWQFYVSKSWGGAPLQILSLTIVNGKLIPIPFFQKVSLTDQWQFSYGHKSLTIVNDTRTYGHLSLTLVNDTKTYGHLSLIVVNDSKNCHWLRSMTKKIVIECILSI